MTALTTISIMLALFLGAAIVIAVRKQYAADILRRKNYALKETVDRYVEAENCVSPSYIVNCIDKPEHELFGRWAVVRICIVGGFIHHTCIKVFTDEDNEYNRRKAEELCEKLNEK